MLKSGLKTFALALTVLFLAGCTAMSAYKLPFIDLPEKSQGETASLSRWWESFDDPALNALVAEALENNADIRIAAAQLEQAQSSLYLARASLFPALDITAGVSRNQISTATGLNFPGIKRQNTVYSTGLVASYEVDIWGRLASIRKGASASLEARSYLQDSVRNTIAAQTVRSYFTLRATDRDLELLEETLKTRQTTVELQKTRLDAGLINAYEFALVESELNSVAAVLPPLRGARDQMEIALAVLAGRAPRQLVDRNIPRKNDLETLVAAREIPAGLPSDLLQRRPDVKAAEQLLLAADADVSAARARWFPSIDLTGALGGESASLSDIMTSAAQTWSLAGLATQPIVGLLTTKARVGRAKAYRKEAEIVYQETARQAYADVLSALSQHTAAREALIEAQNLYANQSKVRDLAEQQLQAGQVGRLDVLDAERQKLAAARGLIVAQQNRVTALVNLYQSLGGGW